MAFEELRELIKDRYTKRPNKNALEMKKVSTSIELEELLREHLVDPTSTLTFEAKRGVLSELQEVIDSPNIRDNYEIRQESDVLFVARMQTVDL